LNSEHILEARTWCW